MTRGPGERLAIYELTTPDLTFAEDLRLYSEVGAHGIGICEVKLPNGNDSELVAQLASSGLAATVCLPKVDSILPQPLVQGPGDPKLRVQALCAGIRRLAQFSPAGVLCTTGPAGLLDEETARRFVIGGLRQAASVAADVGVKLALEPISKTIADDWSIVTDMKETLDLLDEVDCDNVGILFDVWHLWNTPHVLEHVRRDGSRIVGVHVSDWREPPRSWCDRALPGEGVIDLASLIRALEHVHYDGFYDLEIFSDDGRFGTALPDSLWNVPPRELVQRAYASWLSVFPDGNGATRSS
jgi:sugar phosphate isomerase/epimerase